MFSPLLLNQENLANSILESITKTFTSYLFQLTSLIKIKHPSHTWDSVLRDSIDLQTKINLKKQQYFQNKETTLGKRHCKVLDFTKNKDYQNIIIPIPHKKEQDVNDQNRKLNFFKLFSNDSLKQDKNLPIGPKCEAKEEKLTQPSMPKGPLPDMPGFRSILSKQDSKLIFPTFTGSRNRFESEESFLTDFSWNSTNIRKQQSTLDNCGRLRVNTMGIREESIGETKSERNRTTKNINVMKLFKSLTSSFEKPREESLNHRIGHLFSSYQIRPKISEKQGNVNILKIDKFNNKRGPYNMLTLEKRIEAVEFAKTHSIALASKKFLISRKRIVRWFKFGPERRKGAGRKTLDPEMELRLVDWIQDVVKRDGVFPTRNTIKTKAKEMCKFKDFRASKGWCDKFFRRNQDILDKLKIRSKDNGFD